MKYPAHDLNLAYERYKKATDGELVDMAHSFLVDATDAASRAVRDFAVERLYLILGVFAERVKAVRARERRLERSIETARKGMVTVEVDKP